MWNYCRKWETTYQYFDFNEEGIIEQGEPPYYYVPLEVEVIKKLLKEYETNGQ